MFQGECIQYIKHLGQLFNIRSMENGLSKLLRHARFFDEAFQIVQSTKLFNKYIRNILNILVKVAKNIPWRIEFDFPYKTV